MNVEEGFRKLSLTFVFRFLIISNRSQKMALWVSQSLEMSVDSESTR
jgi:hypothetical protein